MTLLNRICALVLALTLVATAAAMAHMRDRDAGARTLVICTGMGTQVITLGADGEALDPAPICPDCTMVLAADISAAFVVPRQMAFTMLSRVDAAQRAMSMTASIQNRPRAPPVPTIYA